MAKVTGIGGVFFKAKAPPSTACLALALVAAVGCSSSPSQPPEQDAAPLDVPSDTDAEMYFEPPECHKTPVEPADMAAAVSFTNALLQRLCEAHLECPSTLFASVKGCVAYGGYTLWSALPMELDVIRLAAASGTAVLLPGAASACLAAFEPGACRQTLPAPCQRPFAGTLGPDCDCRGGLACKSGFCSTLCYRCTASSAPDEPCANFTPCREDGVCVRRTCWSRTPGLESEPCHPWARLCAPGLVCAQQAGAGEYELVCQAPLLLGAQCDKKRVVSRCGVNLRCSGEGELATCTPKLQQGAACKDKASKKLPCVDELECLENPNGTYTCRAQVGLGQPCVISKDCLGVDSYCADPTPTQGAVCRVAPSLGETCRPTNWTKGEWKACLPPYYCRTSAQECLPFATQGAWCSSGDVYCAAGLQCIKNKCQHHKKFGQACGNKVGHCEPGLTCDAALKHCRYDKSCKWPVL